ncbi:MAG: SpoIVB peptidase [Oscillospiraceae bacterium]|nr:SpoIVB peptidase [Oscillospiraceae bacterium]
MRKLIRALAALGTVAASLLFALIIYIQYIIPDNLLVGQNGRFMISERLTLVAVEEQNLLPKVVDASGQVFGLQLRPGGEPVQEVLSYVEARMVIPGGNPFGIKLRTDGVLVVGMTDVQKGTTLMNPAKEAGIKAGDILTHINGERLEEGNCVRRIVTDSNGSTLTFSLQRGGEAHEVSLSPVLSDYDREFKAGIWVRDSSAGIGTITYFDPASGLFAGLGHGVCDIDTGVIMPLSTGTIVDVNISGVHAGQSGRPGELQGAFLSDSPLGALEINTEAGLFGILTATFPSHDPIPMARRSEIEPGPALIYATISGNKPQAFEAYVEKVNHSDISPTKNMVIRVTDQRLLDITGGIVQGMSGSPIIQNGRLAGAVTHVFVNDPSRGYAIFAENMDKYLRSIEGRDLAA